MFTNYDVSLTLYAQSGTAELFDPQALSPYRFTDGPTLDGQYTEDRGGFKLLRLLTASDVLTDDESLAVFAEAQTNDGTTYRFELYRTQSTTGPKDAGRLIRVSDRNNNLITIAWQFPVGASDSTLGYERTALRRMTSVTDPYGKSISFTYTRTQGQFAIATAALPNATTITYRYDRSPLVGVNRVELPLGEVATFNTAFDAGMQAQEIRYDDPSEAREHRRKSVFLTTSRRQLAPGTNISGTLSRAPNRIAKQTNGAGEVSYRAWTQGTGPWSIYVYEGGGELGAGRLMRIDTNAGAINAVSIAKSFNITVDPPTYVWETVSTSGSDASLRTTSESDALGRTTTYTRAPTGEVLGAIQQDAFGTTLASESTTYNAFRFPLVHNDRLGRITEHQYDSKGNLEHKIVARGSSVQATSHWSYNARGQLLSHTDANGNVTDYVYDEVTTSPSYRRLLSVIEPPDVPAGPRATTNFTYDSVGRLLTSTDAENRTATRTYDARNRLTRITYHDTTYEEWTYGTGTNANLVVNYRDRNGNQEAYAYDLAGRRTGRTRSSPTAVVVSQSAWTYRSGRVDVATETIDGETTLYGYDHQARQVSVTRQANSASSLVKQVVYGSDQRVSYEVDPHGRRTYYVFNRNDLPTRTVRELIPGSVNVSGTPSQMEGALSGMSRITAPNPAYVIEDAGYDAAGQITSRTDAKRIISLFEWDAQGRLKAQVDAATDASTVPSTIVPYAARTEFGYDANGNRTTVVHPRSFTHNPTTGVFTQIATPFVTVSTYTGRNLLKSVTEASGTTDAATVNFTYTLTKQKASQSDPRNPAWLTQFTYYACCNRLYQVIDALGFATTYTYDANGNVLSVRDANNTGETRTYDARNRPLTVTNTDNETTTITYDENLTDGVGLSGTYASKLTNLNLTAGADGFAVETRNHLGETTLEIRDGVGRVVRRVDGNGNQTTASYDGVVGGLVATTLTDALNNSSTSYADGSGRVRQAIDAQNRTSTATFDANGNQLTARDPNNVGWTATYDVRNRRLTTTDTHGDATAYTYDLHGNVLTTRDALLKTQQCTYDYRDRKVTCTDRLEPVAGITGYQYDAANHLVKITDADSALNGVTDYGYDQRGKLNTEIFPAGKDGKRTVRTYAYDNGGRLRTRTLTTTPAATPALNEVTTYGYDNANRLTSRTYNDGKGNDTFTYDDAGRLLTAVSGRYASTVTRVYTGNTPAEKAGRLTSETLALTGANAGTWTVGYQYDAANRLSTLTYPTSDTSTRTYTSRNQLDTVTFAGANVATRTYDNGGRLTGTTFGNTLVETRTYRSDANGVDNQLATQVIPGVTNFSYTYDANKRITQETNGIFANQTQQFAAYDNENRLTSWSRGTDTQTWTLSKVGDWTSTTINGVAQSRTHSAVHEISTIGATPLSYDLKGNLTQNLDGSAYAWDSENRLTSATVTDTDYAVNDTATYRYDALGRRVQKSVYGMATTFIHAGAQVIHEFDAKIQLASSASTDNGTGTGTPPGGGILQGAGVTRVNYQPSLSPIPPGFIADKGAVYGTRSNGKSYGWLTTARTDTVIRNQHRYPQYDTFNQAWLGNTGSAGTWEIALANGSYAVVVVMGDCASANQTNNITIEGQAQTDPDPAVATPPGYRRGDFDGYAVTANITDGKLTLAFPATAVNPKICFIEIGPLGSSIAQADRDRLAAAIVTATDDTGIPAFPKAQPSPRQYVYGSYVDEPLMMRANGNKYYYATNRLYTVAAITNQTGQVVERYKYDAYGKQAILADNGSVAYKPSDYGQFHGFTGRYHDWETGLIYFRSRDLDPNAGRFIGRDDGWAPTSASLKNDNEFTGNHAREPHFRRMYRDGMSLYGAYFVPGRLDPSGMLVEIWTDNGDRYTANTASELINILSHIKPGEISAMKITGHGGSVEQQFGVNYPEERIVKRFNDDYLTLRGLGIGGADSDKYGEVNFNDLINGKFKKDGLFVYDGCFTGSNEWNIARYTSQFFPDLRVWGRKGTRQTFPYTDTLNILAQVWYSTLYENGLNYYKNGNIYGGSTTPGILGPAQP